VTGSLPPSPRLTPRQAVLWGVAFLIVVVLVILFFINGKQVQPVLGLHGGAWQTTWS
jgi:hypothetical protein